MANIPVHPAKRGVPWWLWALILLAIAAVVAYVFLMNDDPEAVARDGADTTSVYVPPATGVDRLGMLPDADDPDPDRYLGRGVRLDGVRVGRVLSDSAFTVEGDDGREWVVVLDEPAGVSTAGSARGFAVASGDAVRLDGTVRRAEAGAVPEAARASLADGSLYVAASAADVVPAAGADSTGSTPPSLPDTTT